MNKKGFTLLEILLVIAAIGIIASIVVVAINPLRQIGKARNASRYGNINTIQKALDQYYIDNGRYPVGVTGSYQEICVDGAPSNCLDLEADLIPKYIAEIPKDPEGGGYKLAINSENTKVSLVADKANVEEEISINPIILKSGVQDPMFNIGSGFDAMVKSVRVQSDGRILVGGDFTIYQGLEANRIIRLNSDGSRDDSFDIGTGFDEQVAELYIQSDGKILVGGNFTTYQGVEANRIIRLNSDGSRDNSFDMGTGFELDIGAPYSHIVKTIRVQSDGRIFVGGDFTIYQGLEANRIIRLNSDGSRDNSFDIGTGFDNWVRTIEFQSDGKIILGGWFLSYKGVGANNIIRLNSDGSRDNSFSMGTGFDSTNVRSINILSDEKILVGGNFTIYQGVEANRIIRLNSDGSRDNSFDIGIGFTGSTVWYKYVQSDGKVIVVGTFMTYQGVNVNKIVRLNNDGSLDDSFDIGIGFDGTVVRDIAVQSDGKLLIGGDFSTYKGNFVNRLIRIQP